MNRVAMLATIAAMGLSACATVDSEPDPVGSPLAVEDPVWLVSDTIRNIEERSTAGRVDAQDYVNAAGRLRAFGARPAAGSAAAAPLDSHWIAAARKLDPGVSVPRSRGRALGPSYRQGLLGPGKRDNTEQLFLAGKSAKIAVTAKGNARLLLVIADSDGKVVCRRSIGNETVGCAWVPLFSDRFAIAVFNRGEQNARYTLVSN